MVDVGDSWDSWLLTGLAEHLAANGLGTWRASGAYVDGEVGIYLRDIPPSPDAAIVLASYPGAGAPDGLADYEQPVQLRFRGPANDSRVCTDLASEAFDLLDSSGLQFWGTGEREIAVVDVARASYTSLGKDGLGRWEASHNYIVTAMRPTIHRSE